MNTRKTISFLLLALLMIASVGMAEEPVLQPLDVKLSILSGQVKLTRVGKTLSDVYSQGFPLFAGDILETLRESKGELVYSDGTVMRLKSLTKVEVQATALKVFKGQSWFKFAKRGSEFVIETPSLVAGIRGTIFDIAVTSRGKSVLSVMEGKVAVKGKSGKEILISAGKATHCEADQNPVSPYSFNVEKKNREWTAGEWNQAGGAGDVNQLYINYLNLKAEYGENDSRALESLKKFEDAQKDKASRKLINKPIQK